MRTVAAELGTSAMALYRYFDNRDELERWIVEYLLAAVDLTLPAASCWQERVTALMDRVRDAVAPHPGAVPLLLAHRHTSRASLQWIETMLAVLTDAGFTDTDLVVAQRGLVSYLVGSLHTQHLGALAGAGTAAMTKLPTSEFPRVADAARQARRLRPDDEFHAGLAVILRGLTGAGSEKPNPTCR